MVPSSNLICMQKLYSLIILVNHTHEILIYLTANTSILVKIEVHKDFIYFQHLFNALCSNKINHYFA